MDMINQFCDARYEESIAKIADRDLVVLVGSGIVDAYIKTERKQRLREVESPFSSELLNPMRLLHYKRPINQCCGVQAIEVPSLYDRLRIVTRQWLIEAIALALKDEQEKNE